MRARLTAAAVLVALALPAVASAAPVIELGSMVPTALNGRQMVGGGLIDQDNPSVDPKPVIWANGTLTELKLPAGATSGEVSGVSASGVVSGAAKTGPGAGRLIRAIRWNSPGGGTMPDELIPPASPTDDYSTTGGVTDAGAVVGRGWDGVNVIAGFLAAPGGGVQRYGPAGLPSGLFGITPSGSHLLGFIGSTDPDVNGWHLSTSAGVNGTKLDLTPVLHASFILGGAISDLYAPDLASDGTLLGYKGTPRTYWLRLPNGSQTQVTGLVGHNAVNARHVVAGTVAVPDGEGGQTPHAAIRKPDGTVIDLNDLLTPAQRSTMELVSALLINDNGDVAGIAANATGQVGFLMPAGYVVDSTGDQPDATPGDGNCLTAATTCTLRAALQEVSGGTSDAPVSVSFDLPSNATTIAPQSSLPAVTKPIAIDGVGNPGGRVLVDGVSAGSGAVGLRLEGDGSRVRNLSVKRFAGAGIRIQASKAVVGGMAEGPSPCPYPCVVVSDSGAGVVVSGAGSTGNELRGNRIVSNGGPAIDLGGDGRTPNDGRDVDTGPNELHNFPTGVLVQQQPEELARSIGGWVDPEDQGATIDVYAQPTVTPGRGAEPTTYIGSTTVNRSGSWVVETEAPQSGPFYSATVTTSEGTSELSPVCGDPDGDGNPDTDGDGLCDDWEIDGLDINDDGAVDLPLHTPAFGANPNHKDLYLELDAMQATGNRTYAPQQLAIDHVVQAFAEAPVSNPDNRLGIALHVNPGGGLVDDTVPEVLSMPAETRAPGSLLNIRDGLLSVGCDGKFGTAADRAASDCSARLAARTAAFRWVLFANTYTEDEDSSGVTLTADGNSLAVTLASWGAAKYVAFGGGLERCRTVDGCRRRLDEATLMHEFGHALGLGHGGTDKINYKPNYLSIMSYSFQFPTHVERPLDYSRAQLPDLVESALIDADGLFAGVDATTRADVVALWPRTLWYELSGTRCSLRTGPTGGAIDWDSSAATSQSAMTVHWPKCDGANERLTAPRDWSNIEYAFRQAAGRGASGEAIPPERRSEELLQESANSDVDRNGVSDLADACRMVPGTDVADANGNGFADLCEADMARLQAFPSQPAGAGQGPAGGPATDVTPPVLSGLTAKPSVARRAKGKRKAVPAKLSFSASEAAVVTFTAERARKGRQSQGKCLASAKKGKACTAYAKQAGALRVDAKAGANTALFTGALGAKKLAAGSYRLTAIAIDASGNAAKPVTVNVTVR